MTYLSYERQSTARKLDHVGNSESGPNLLSLDKSCDDTDRRDESDAKCIVIIIIQGP